MLREGNCVIYSMHDLKKNFIIPSLKYEKYETLLYDFFVKMELNQNEQNLEQWKLGFSRLFSKQREVYYEWRVISLEDFFELEKNLSFQFRELDSTLEKMDNFFKRPCRETCSINGLVLNRQDATVFLEPILQFYQLHLSNFKNFQVWSNNIKKKELVISSSLTLENKKQLQKNEMSCFAKISSKQAMLNFLNSSSSLYHQLCFWFLKYPISQFKEKPDTHHILPVYLTKKDDFPKHVNIHSSFNLIQVPYIIHMFLHLIRAIEFLYHEDLKPIKLAFAHLKDNLWLKNTFANMLEIFKKAIKNDELLSVRQDNINNLLRVSKKARLSKRPVEMLEFFNHGFTFSNIIYPIPDQKFQPNEAQENVDILKILRLVTENYLNEYPQIEKPKKWNLPKKKLSSYLTNYLFKGKNSKNGPFWGWVLTAASSSFSHVLYKKPLAKKK